MITTDSMKTADDTNWQVLDNEDLAGRLSDPRFVFGEEDYAYIDSRGMDLLKEHVYDFVRRRLAPSSPKNEGRQTPLRGHPVFLAQHATGSHCRSSIQKIYGISAGRPMIAEEIDFIVDIIVRRIEEQIALREV